MDFILSAIWWVMIRGLWKFPNGRDWLRGKLGLALMGRAKHNKSLIQFSNEGWGCIPSLLFDLRRNYGGGNEDNGSVQFSSLAQSCMTLRDPRPPSKGPMPHSVPQTLQQATASLPFHGDSWILLGKSQSVSCGVTAPFFCIKLSPIQKKNYITTISKRSSWPR